MAVLSEEKSGGALSTSADRRLESAVLSARFHVRKSSACLMASLRFEGDGMVGWIALGESCVCTWAVALYIVSMPSGMMTMSEVPTSTPAPSRVRVRSCRGVREKESGTMPAMKELGTLD